MEPRRRASLFDAPKWLSVYELNQMARRTVEEAHGRVSVTGEASNVTHAASGHVYFTLKDARAQLSVVIWRSTAQRLPLRVRDGDALNITGALTIYEVSGRYQLIAERVEAAGLGALEARFRELKAAFEAAGYFAPERKRSLPFLPRCIGVVTSPSGAAIRDILESVHSRMPRAKVLLVPVRVQGAGAAEEIARAIERLNELEACDVMIVGRGGGSLEDLWAFNEPIVVDAIFESVIPVVSAVGHEIDVTLSDLVADLRALTPTDAGIKVVPRMDDIMSALDVARTRLSQRVRASLDRARLSLRVLERSSALAEPRRLVERRGQALDDLERALVAALSGRCSDARRHLDQKERRLGVLAPSTAVARVRARLDQARLKAENAVREALTSRASGLEAMRLLLSALAPDRVLERGYTMTFDAKTKKLVRSMKAVANGQRLVTRFADGQVTSIAEGDA